MYRSVSRWIRQMKPLTAPHTLQCLSMAVFYLRTMHLLLNYQALKC